MLARARGCLAQSRIWKAGLHASQLQYDCGRAVPFQVAGTEYLSVMVPEITPQGPQRLILSVEILPHYGCLTQYYYFDFTKEGGWYSKSTLI